MTPHGPDTATFESAVSDSAESPARIASTALAFMFETSATPRITPAALGSPYVDRNYYRCWAGLRSHFDRAWTPSGSPLQGERMVMGKPSLLSLHPQQAVAGGDTSKAPGAPGPGSGMGQGQDGPVGHSLGGMLQGMLERMQLKDGHLHGQHALEPAGGHDGGKTMAEAVPGQQSM